MKYKKYIKIFCFLFLTSIIFVNFNNKNTIKTKKEENYNNVNVNEKTIENKIKYIVILVDKKLSMFENNKLLKENDIYLQDIPEEEIIKLKKGIETENLNEANKIFESFIH